MQALKEDLIELITSLTVSGELSQMIILLCRVSTREEEMTFLRKF
jgi:hypothetical protein